MFLTELIPKPLEAAGMDVVLLKYTATITLTTFVGRTLARDVADTYSYLRGVLGEVKKPKARGHAAGGSA